jgi:hypothetical protein
MIDAPRDIEVAREPERSRVIKFMDAEGDPTRLDVVEVPEGYSFQMYDVQEEGYISVIISPDDATRLLQFLLNPRLNK